MMIDSLGSFYVYRHNRKIFKKLRDLGAKVVFFMPVISNPLRNYINYRNHRKIYIFDNHTIFSGGMNIGDEYMSPIEHQGMWDDLLFKIQGESLIYFLKVFVLIGTLRQIKKSILILIIQLYKKVLFK